MLAAKELAALRERFAILGHDLRNQLQAIIIGADLLKLSPLDDRSLRNVNRIERSCERMAELISNMPDLARGSLGGGIPVSLRPDDDLVSELRQVVAEIRTAIRST